MDVIPLLQTKTADTAHIQQFLQVTPGPFSNFWVGPGDKATLVLPWYVYRAFSCDVITFEIMKENGKQPPCWCTTR